MKQLPYPDGPLTGEWLDSPAILGGEQFVLNDTFPIEIKIIGASLLGLCLFAIILLIYCETL